MKRPNTIGFTGHDHNVPAQSRSLAGHRPANRLSDSHRLPGMQTNRKTILLVEDDPQVREIGILAIRGGGYEVLSAESASQALRLWAQHADRIDVLVTDMMIPNCSTGLELALRFRAENPSLPVIITSGFGPEIAGDQAPDLQALSYLRKPFKPDELLRIVANALRIVAR